MDSRKSSSDTSNNVGGRRGSRRGSIFDLMFLLRRGSSWRKETNVEAAHAGEQDPFLKRDDGDEENQQLSREEILEKIREKKECIEKLRCQPWSMQRKLRTLRLAQKCLERHESKVSKSQLFREEAGRHWKKFKRWVVNVSVYVIPWEAKIKQIESHFGSVVSSYFTFVRWIFWINLIMSILTGIFIVLPGVWSDVFNKETPKIVDPMDMDNDTTIQSIWNFEGFLLRTPLFYNFYGKQEYVGAIRYQLPLAYFLMYVVVLAYSFFAILRKMAQNARRSKLSAGKQEHYTFSWILFTGWDYTIGNPETAANTSAANANKLKETMMEYKAKQKEKFVWLLFLSRVLANILIMAMLCGSTYLVYWVVERSRTIPKDAGAFRQNEVPITVSLITLFFPNLFEIVGKLEKYHPRIALRLQLARVLLLYLLNFYTLIIALFYKMQEIEALQSGLGRNFSENFSPKEPIDQVVRMIRQVESPENANLTPGLVGLPIPLFTLLQNFLQNVTRAPELTSGTTTQLIPNTTANPLETTYIPFVTNVKARIEPDTLGPLDPRPPFEIIPLQKNFTTETISPLDTSTYLSIFTTEPTVTTAQMKNEPPTTSARINPDITTLTSPATTVDATTKRTRRPKTTTLAPRRRTTAVPASTYTNLIDNNSTLGIGLTLNESLTTAIPVLNVSQNLFPSIEGTSAQKQLQTSDLKHVCWETHMGQEICRLITMDFIMTVASVIVIDLVRGLVVRFCNPWWCWNLETEFPEYGEFKVAENVLHIVNNQGMIWLGLFFSPLLPAVNNIKLILLMYIRGWAVMTCNVPAEQVFRASRSNNFYLIILLLMLFLCTLPVIFVMATQRPSNICGPFKPYGRFYEIITKKLKNTADGKVYSALQYVVSPGIVIPFLLLLMLVIYFMICLTRGLRESNEDLKKQLMVERTEEKRKIYAMAEGKNHHDAFGHEPTMPDTKKVSKAHLPAKELRKLDSWRDKIPLHRSGMRERSDSNETSASSEDSQQPSPSRVWVKQEPSMTASIHMSPSHHFTPSLKCLPEESSDAEGHTSADEGRRLLDRTKSDGQIKNFPVPRLEGLEVLTRSSPNVSPSILKKRPPASTSSGSDSDARTPHVVRDLIANILPSDEEPLLAGKRNFPGSTNDVYTSDVEPMERARYPSDLSQYTNDQTPRTPASILDSISPDEIRRLLRPIDRRAVEPIRVQPEIFATKSPTEDIRLLMEFSSTDDTGLSSGESDMEKFARLRSMVEQGEKKKPWRQETLKSPPSTVVNIDKRPAQVHQNESSPEISEESQTEVPKSQKPLLTNDPKISKPFITDKDSTPSHTQTNAPEKPIASKPTEESAKKPEIPKSLPLISSIESLKPADTSSYKVPKAWDISPDLQSSTKEEENASDESCSSEETTMSTSVVKAKPSGLDSSKPLATTFVAWPAPDEVKLKPVRVLEPISTEIISTPSETEIEEESQVEETPMRRPRLKIKMSPSSSCASSPSPDRKPLIIKQTMVKSSSPMRKPTEGPTDSPKASKPPIPHVKPESPANVAKRPTLPGSLSGSDSESSSSLGPRSSRASLTKAAGHRTRPESPAKVRSRPPIPTGSQQGKFSKSFKEAKSDSTEQSSKESNV